MPLISIIIPVYNAEFFLHRCLDSLLMQKFTNFEIILINDGGKDNSGKICDEYANNNPKIRVFHTLNGGPGKARNKGLKEAQGTYICFVDSDDYVDSEYLQTFINEIQYHQSVDCCIQGYLFQDQSYSLPHTLYTAKSKTKGIYETEINSLFGILWNKIYRKDIIKQYQIQFDINIYLGEDMLFILTYFQHINNFIVTDHCFYHYTDNANSLTSRKYPLVHLEKRIKAVEKAIKDLSENKNDPFLLQLLAKDFLFSLRTVHNMYHFGLSTRQERISFLKYCKKQLQTNHYIKYYIRYSKKEKLICALIQHSPIKFSDKILYTLFKLKK